MWLDVLDKGYGTALILEDDVDMDVDIKVIMADVHDAMKEVEWDLLYLSTCTPGMGQPVSLSATTPRPFSTPRTGLHARSGADRVHTLPGTYCTHAYAVSAAGARLLVDNLSNTISRPIDVEMNDHLHKFKGYTLHPAPINQKPKTSDNPSDIRARESGLDHFAELPYSAHNMLAQLQPYRIGTLVHIESTGGTRLCFDKHLTTGCTDPSSYVFRMISVVYRQIAIHTPRGHLQIDPTGQMNIVGGYIGEWQTFHVTDNNHILSYHHTCLGLDGDRVVISAHCERFQFVNEDDLMHYLLTSQGTYVQLQDSILYHTTEQVGLNVFTVRPKMVMFALSNFEYLHANEDGPLGSSSKFSDLVRFEIEAYGDHVEIKSRDTYLRLRKGKLSLSIMSSRFRIRPVS
jgi:hypothetical protein